MVFLHMRSNQGVIEEFRHWMSRIKAVQMDNFRGLLGIRRIDKMPNARIRELCRVAKCLDEKIDESVPRWFGHIERLIKGYMWECMGSRLVGRPGNRWMDSVNDCLKKRGLNDGQARRMVYDDRNERGSRGVVRGNT